MAEQDTRPMPLHPINIVFDGPPAHESGRFVEVEDDDGRGLGVGEWIERPDGLWSLRIEPPDTAQLGLATTQQLLDELTARIKTGAGYELRLSMTGKSPLDYRTFDAH